MARAAGCFRKWWRHEFRKTKGVAGIAAIEIGEDYNVHVHVLAYVPFTDVYEASRAWLDITGDSVCIWIRPFRGPLMRGINYVLKYILKGCHSPDPQKTMDYLLASIGKRCLITKGAFYKSSFKVLVYQICFACGEEGGWQPGIDGNSMFDIWTDAKFEWFVYDSRDDPF